MLTSCKSEKRCVSWGRCSHAMCNLMSGHHLGANKRGALPDGCCLFLGAGLRQSTRDWFSWLKPIVESLCVVQKPHRHTCGSITEPRMWEMEGAFWMILSSLHLSMKIGISRIEGLKPHQNDVVIGLDHNFINSLVE